MELSFGVRTFLIIDVRVWNLYIFVRHQWEETECEYFCRDIEGDEKHTLEFSCMFLLFEQPNFSLVVFQIGLFTFSL